MLAMRRIFLALLWIGFVIYAFGFAPPAQPDTLALIQQLSTGQWAAINPAVVALFNLMGVWPMIYACLVLIDGRAQSVPAWPFVALSFGVGAFALLPYLVLRTANSASVGGKDWLLKLVDARLTGIGIAIAALILLAYGLLAGDWSDFLQQWRTSRFIHVMSLDFCLLCLLPPTLLGDDMARRGLNSPAVFWAAALVPLLGPAVYLALRPPLEATTAAAVTS
ncbi:MAG: DUF2834 domain-containing protein [Leptolyngbya sp. SIO4C1]|nr:DUF2834 domain-containing protein [Leptolyngbya sp. SIO4C1]